MPLAQLMLFPEQASTVAPAVDALTMALTFITVFFTVLIACVLMYFAIKYRRRSEQDMPQPIVGSLKLEIVWTTIPLVIGLMIAVWSSRLYLGMYRPPDDSLDVYVVGKQWMWKMQHPGGQREINELHIPVNEPVKLTMISEDVIHSYFIPAFRIKQDVLPNRYSSIWFQASQVGTFDLFCAEYCGTWHSKMIGKIVVMEPADYERWLRERAEGSPALEGGKLFRKLRCITCHAADAQARAPLLENLYGRTVPLQDNSQVLADEDYLRRSILRPREQIVAGYQPIMPTYEGQVTEEEILQLIAFIRSLGTGATPSRLEESSPPAVKPDEKK